MLARPDPDPPAAGGGVLGERAALLSDPDFFRSGDVHELWRQLRRDAPVAWSREHDGPGFWSVTRYPDARRVLLDAETFASAGGTVLSPDRHAANPGGGRMLGLMDPPDHGRLRVQLNPAFTPSAVRASGQRVRALIAAELDAQPAAGPLDAVATLADRVPVVVLGALMGLPPEATDELARTVRALTSSTPGEQRMARVDLLDLLSEVCAARSGEGDRDLTDVIAAAHADGCPLSGERRLLNSYNIFTAGVATTAIAIAGAIRECARDPGLLPGIRTGRLDAATTTEELLRWTSPGTVFMRTATRDSEVSGQRVAAGARIAVWLASANRDERIFEDADHLLPGRTPNPHIAFGVGRHFCIGAALARMEVRIVLEEMAARWERVTLAGAARYAASTIAYGLDALPVCVEHRDPARCR